MAAFLLALLPLLPRLPKLFLSPLALSSLAASQQALIGANGYDTGGGFGSERGGVGLAVTAVALSVNKWLEVSLSAASSGDFFRRIYSCHPGY